MMTDADQVLLDQPRLNTPTGNAVKHFGSAKTGVFKNAVI
jgi:hypothetical protein